MLGALQGCIEVVYIRRMVFAVVNLHGAGVDMRFEGRGGVG